MKSYLPLLSFAIIVASCSTAYKSGQTPDDVYYSPERQHDEYVHVEKKQDRMYYNETQEREDRYVRMVTRNRRFSLLDDCDCYCYNTGGSYYRYNDPYRYNRYALYNDFWRWNRWGYNDPFFYNPYYNNPYYTGVVVARPIYNRPRTTNLHVFDGGGNNYNSNLPKSNGRTYGSTPSTNDDNYRGSGSSAGGYLRNIFNSGSSSSGSSSSSSSSGSSSSSSSGSSSSSSGSSSAPVRKF